jgi:hypothetical protein
METMKTLKNLRLGLGLGLVSFTVGLAALTGCATRGTTVANETKSASIRERFGDSARKKNWLVGAAKPAGAETLYVKGESRIVQPFFILGSRAVNHVIVWFDGHETYVSVEAFVYSKDRIRVILTRRDNIQIDAVNFEGNEISPLASERERYVSKIDFRIADNGKDAELRLTTPEGEQLDLVYAGQGKPDTQYGGMTDTGLHSPEGGLPAFFRDASGVGAKGSFVRIGEKTYRVPEDKEISVPPFFTAYSAFLSTGYVSFILPTFPRQSFPVEPADGQNIVTRERAGVAEIVSIRGGGNTELRFNPPLANIVALKDGMKCGSRFAVFFNGAPTEEIYGTVEISKTGSRTTVSLKPEYPAWTKAVRSMVYEIALTGDTATVSAAMAKKTTTPEQAPEY